MESRNAQETTRYTISPVTYGWLNGGAEYLEVNYQGKADFSYLTPSESINSPKQSDESDFPLVLYVDSSNAQEIDQYTISPVTYGRLSDWTIKKNSKNSSKN